MKQLPLQAFWLFVFVISVAACSGSPSSSVPPAGNADTTSAQSASGAAASVMPNATNITVQGTVTAVQPTPSFHVTIPYSGKSVAVYSSEIKSAIVGDVISATGYFKTSTTFLAASAHIVSTPKPTATPKPTPPPTAALQLLQVFDNQMTLSQVTTTAKQISYLWGGGSSVKGVTAAQWQAANPNLTNILYFYQGTDDPTLSGHSLSWFTAKHPDWIVYDCDTNNQPTTTVAYQPGLSGVPLDITNSAVISYQIHLAANAAIARKNNAIGSDQTVFFDYDGGQYPGWFGCGIYAGPNYTHFERRWGSTVTGFPNYDPKWASDTATWVKTAKSILTTDGTLAPHHLKLAINHPLGDPSSANEATLMSTTDMELDEEGFADYGKYITNALHLGQTLSYMTFVQSHGTTFLAVDKFSTNRHGTSATAGISNDQLAWAIATYLLGTQGHAAFYVTIGPYGVPSYFPQYATVNSRIGTACAAYATAASGHVFYRRYTGGFAVANDGGAGTENITLPSHTYTDLMGATITNPLSIDASKAFVLFTTANGCT